MRWQQRRFYATVIAFLLAAACGSDSGGATTTAATSTTAATTTTLEPVAACSSTTTDEGADPAPTALPDDLTELSVARVELPGEAMFVASSGDALWVTSVAGQLWRVDASSGAVTHAFEYPDLGLSRPAVGQGSVWLAVSTGLLLRLDPTDGSIEAEIMLAPTDRPMAFAFDDSRVLVANQTANTVTVIDEGTNAVVETYDLSAAAGGSDRAPSSVVVEGGIAWVVEHRADAVVRIDLASGSMTHACVGSPDPGSSALVDGSVWVADSGTVISIVTPDTLEVTARYGIPGVTVGDLALDGSVLWVGAGSHIVGIDVASMTITFIVATGDLADDREFAPGVTVAVTDDSVWTTDPAGNALLRIAKAPPG